ncbi:DUF29 domain-containing protein [Geminocystis sp. CENA526]|uniref:DUF29 domain-containing protein n=1 Tax=Geminocystis sp. CENA526 TaxID=1355871 RepID=UPI003D6FE603
MIVSTPINLKELYEIDDYLWIQETVKLLKEKKFNELDLDNLIEELDDVGKERRKKVESLLEQIIRHLLLWQYWQEERDRCCRHWEGEIFSFRRQLKKDLTTNFYNYLSQELPNIYDDAWGYVTRKSGLKNLPENCPYTLKELLDENWLPDIN